MIAPSSDKTEKMTSRIGRRIPEELLYTVLFLGLSLFFLIFGYATLGTNDDWALRSLLAEKGVYGTLIMSYPLSFIMSKLYQYFPDIQWYSLLLTSVVFLDFYLITLYIKSRSDLFQKVILTVLGLLFLSYVWFNISITIVTIITVLCAIGLFKRHLSLAFILMALASLLRTDMVLIFTPLAFLSFFFLRDHFKLSKIELAALALPIAVIAFSFWIQNQDKAYMQWLRFNHARSTVLDMGILDTKKILSENERRFLSGGWVQDERLLPTQKVIASAPSLGEIITQRLGTFDLDKISKHHFYHWLYLLLFFSLLALILNIRNKKSPLLALFIIGGIALIVVRDVDRVTIPLLLLWVLLLLDMLKNRYTANAFLLVFTSIFAYYFYPQIGYHYYKENTLLLKEAKELIRQHDLACEPSLQFPTNLSQEEINIFQSLFLFREHDWLRINAREILPAGWLSRHPYFYEAHDLSCGAHERRFTDYHAFLTSGHSAFIGGKELTSSETTQILLTTYDEIYLKDRPECRHTTAIVASSEHFALSQIQIKCGEPTK